MYTDQIERSVNLPAIPQRIVSLVPSQTELLHALGLEETVVGITKFCVHPEHWFREKTRVGGTKNVKAAVVASLQPDLIIANKEENVAEQVHALENIAPVWVSDVETIDDALHMIASIGEIVNRSAAALEMIQQLRDAFTLLETAIAKERLIRTAYLIWKEPYMAAGGDTFIHDVMRLGGFENVWADTPRYPSVTTNDLQERQTQLVLLSSEPYPFREQHVAELQATLPHATIQLVDGEMFSWYGSRMQHIPPYLTALRERLHL